MEDEYYTVEEVAKRFKVTRAAVYKWMRAGELPYVIVGKDRRVTGAALKAFVKPGRSGEETIEDRRAARIAQHQAITIRAAEVEDTGMAGTILALHP